MKPVKVKTGLIDLSEQTGFSDLSFDQRVGVVVRAKRALLGQTQESLAQRLGASLEDVQSWESGAAALPLPQVPAITAVLRLSLQDLLGKAEPASSAQDTSHAWHFDDLTPDVQRLVRDFCRIQTPRTRDLILDVVAGLARQERDEGRINEA